MSMKEIDRFVVIDFETTGLNSKKRAVEVAWFELNKKFEIIDEQSSLVNPMIPIPWDASRIHGITDEMVAESPTLDEFIVDINQNPFASSNVCVIAHNLSFDLPLFRKYCGSVVELCTLKLARALYPDWENHKLETISEMFGFPTEDSHRARSDALKVLYFLTLLKDVEQFNFDEMLQIASPRFMKENINEQYCARCFLFIPNSQKNCAAEDDSCPLFC